MLTVGAVGLAARLVVATILVPRAEHAAHLAPDADRYSELGASLLDRGELGFAPPGASPTSVRGPIFPGWLALGMTLSRSMRWIALWANVPGLIAAIAIALLLERSHGAIAAWSGGLIAAVHPLACFASARVLPDEFYGAVLFLGIAAWAAASRGERAWERWAALAGILLAAAALTRVTALGVFAALALPRGSRKAVAIAALVAALPLAAWTVRTTTLAGAPTLVESLPGYNFWLGESADRTGFASGYGESRHRAHELMSREAGATELDAPMFRYATLDPVEAHLFDAKLARAARAYVAAHPIAYAKRCVAGVFWFWCRAETAARTAQYALVSFPVLLFALAGWRKTTSLDARMLAAVIVVHVAVYAALCPMARYSVQLAPLLAYLGGIGVSALAARFRRQSDPIASSV